MKASDIRLIIRVTLFAIAMGYLESAVVIYLRGMFYPDGFAFPLKIMGPDIAVTEIFREVATLVMLLGIAFIAGRSKLERFGFFIFVFGIWDIFYYVFLKILIGWPESWLTWDILYLLPTTWIGPVIAPVINALSMVFFGIMIWYYQSKNTLQKVRIREWILLAAGSIVVIISYTREYVVYLHREFSIGQIFFPADGKKLMEVASQYAPEHFSWWIFWIGQMMIFAGIFLWMISHRFVQIKETDKTDSVKIRG